jgi:hypothetical protein
MVWWSRKEGGNLWAMELLMPVGYGCPIPGIFLSLKARAASKKMG